MAAEPKTLYWEDVREGQELPEQAREIDTTLIVSGAIWASHDFMPVHHDPKFAQEKGAPHIFMNILTTNGLVGTYLGNWTGPQGEIKKLSISLAVPNFPNDEMRMNGKVTRKYTDAGQHLVEVAVSGDNRMGPHVTGSAVLALPSRG
ncbi:MAG: MaoC/PaaZ C-terminal domain-containing protein [Candidatus Binatia bacterium]